MLSIVRCQKIPFEYTMLKMLWHNMQISLVALMKGERVYLMINMYTHHQNKSQNKYFYNMLWKQYNKFI